MSTNLSQSLREVQLVALDVDGVMTDGGVYVFDDGTEFRRFNIKDGLGIRRLLDLGISVIILSSSASECVRHRARSLGISEIFLNLSEKLPTLLNYCKIHSLSLDSVAYMGDDLLDIPILAQVGLPCTVADATADVLARCTFISKAVGGYGAVRELADAIIESHCADSISNTQ